MGRGEEGRGGEERRGEGRGEGHVVHTGYNSEQGEQITFMSQANGLKPYINTTPTLPLAAPLALPLALPPNPSYLNQAEDKSKDREASGIEHL